MSSVPAGAAVRVNGKLLGITPAVIETAAFARVQIEIEKPGFGAYRKPFVARPGQRNEVSAVLRPALSR